MSPYSSLYEKPNRTGLYVGIGIFGGLILIATIVVCAIHFCRARNTTTSGAGAETPYDNNDTASPTMYNGNHGAYCPPGAGLASPSSTFSTPLNPLEVGWYYASYPSPPPLYSPIVPLGSTAPGIPLNDGAGFNSWNQQPPVPVSPYGPGAQYYPRTGTGK